MATKSITIDVEACERLKGVQRAKESFSENIKRVVWKTITNGQSIVTRNASCFSKILGLTVLTY